MSRKFGVSEQQLRDLKTFEESAAFSTVEKLVLRYAIAMTLTPARVPDELFTALKAYFSPKQIVELTAAIAWENYRARFNRPFEVGSESFSDGAFCPMPE